MNRSLRVLWADDQVDVQATLSGVLIAAGMSVTSCASGDAALALLGENGYDLVILDLRMPPGEWGGLWLLDKLADSRIDVPSVVLSGEGTQHETIRALRAGADDYVVKDDAAKELLDCIKRVLLRREPAKRAAALIALGESAMFEMKETLRWNIHTKSRDKAIEHSAAKSIAAFLNTDGGTLVIGVSDKGQVVGLDCEGLRDRDAILRTFDNLTTNWISDTASTMLKVSVVELEGSDILIAECSKSSLPVYVNSVNGQEKEFYIRRQASSVKLSVDECVAYVQDRFRKI